MAFNGNLDNANEDLIDTSQSRRLFMRRIGLLAIAAPLTLAVLQACGGETATPTPEAEVVVEATEEPTEEAAETEEPEEDASPVGAATPRAATPVSAASPVAATPVAAAPTERAQASPTARAIGSPVEDDDATPEN